MSFSKVFRGFMVTYSLTNEGVASQLDRNPSNVSRWKNNQKPRQDSLGAIITYAKEVVHSHEVSRFETFINNYVVDTIPNYRYESDSEEALLGEVDRIFSWAYQDMKIIDATLTIEKFQDLFDQNKYWELSSQCRQFIEESDNYLCSHDAFMIYTIYGKTMAMVSNQNRSLEEFHLALKYLEKAESTITEVNKEKVFQLARYRGMVYGVTSNWYQPLETCKKAIYYNEVALQHYDPKKCDSMEYVLTLNNMINSYLIMAHLEQATTNKKNAYKYMKKVFDLKQSLSPAVRRHMNISHLRLLSELIICDNPTYYFKTLKEAYASYLVDSEAQYTSNDKAEMIRIISFAYNEYGSLIDDKALVKSGLDYTIEAQRLYDDTYEVNKLISYISEALIQNNLMDTDNCDAVLEENERALLKYDEGIKDHHSGSDFAEYGPTRDKAEFYGKVQWLYYTSRSNCQMVVERCEVLEASLMEAFGQEAFGSDYHDLLFRVYKAYGDDQAMTQLYLKVKAYIEAIDTSEDRVDALDYYILLRHIRDLIVDVDSSVLSDVAVIEDVTRLIGLEDIRKPLSHKMTVMMAGLKAKEEQSLKA